MENATNLLRDTIESDDAQARSWAGGDERAFNALVVRYAPIIHARCRNALGATDAEDATQAVFMVLARRGEQAHASPALSHWLFAVTRRVIANALRDRNRRQRAEASAPLLTCSDAPANAVSTQDLDSALSALPEGERMVVQLHFLAGHTIVEVASHVGSPRSTVHERIHRALEKMRLFLTSRGVVVSALVLTTALHAYATKLPDGLVIGSHASAHAASHAGQTSLRRALRWSRMRDPAKILIMSVTVGLAVCLFSLLALDWRMSIPASRPAAVQGSLGATDPTPPHVAPAAPDRGLFIVRLNDGPRTLARMHSSPELSLLPTMIPELRNLASIRSAAVAIGPGSEQGKAHQIYGHLEADAANAPILALMRKRLSSGSFLGFDIHAAQITVDGAALQMRAGPQSPEMTRLLPSREGDADVEVRIAHTVSPSGTAAAGDGPLQDMTFTIGGNGLRASFTSPWADAQAAAVGSGYPRVDQARFTSMPGDAIAALIIALKPASTRQTTLYRSLHNDVAKLAAERSVGFQISADGCQFTLKMNTDHDRTIANAILEAFASIDGTIRMWVEPGEPTVSFSLMADMPRSAYAAVLSATRASPAGDGTVKLGSLSMGWRNGLFLATTKAEGLSSVIESGGFCDHAEVRTALKAMSGQKTFISAVCRPQQVLAVVAPFVPLPDHSRLAQQQICSYLLAGATAAGVDIHGDGLEVMLMAAIVTDMVLPAELMMKTAN